MGPSIDELNRFADLVRRLPVRQRFSVRGVRALAAEVLGYLVVAASASCADSADLRIGPLWRMLG